MAKKLDWFPLHVPDLLTSRKMLAMLPEERGWYVLLLAHEWDGGPLPLDMAEMGALLGIDGNRMATAWQRIGRAFAETPDGYVNERLEAVRREQIDRVEAHSRAGARGAEARWGERENGNRNAGAIATGMQDKKREEERTPKSTGPANGAPDPLAEGFREFWTAYPPRAGNRAKKEALRAWRARRREKVDAGRMTEAAGRYRTFCDREGKTGTEVVMRASTFLNDPDNFDNPWGPSLPPQRKPVLEDLPPDLRKHREETLAVEAWMDTHPDEAEQLQREADEENVRRRGDRNMGRWLFTQAVLAQIRKTNRTAPQEVAA